MSQPLRRPISLFVAESSPISSQLLAEALARDSGIAVMGFSSDPVEIMRVLAASCVDVLVVSARMEENPTRGLGLLRQVRTQHAGLKAVVLLDSSKPDVVVEAFRSGACGVFCRDASIRLLRRCVTALHSGQIWANSEELGYVFSALATDAPFRLDKTRLTLLSPREREVVRCLTAGLTNREISQTLALSQHTVKNYMFKIFEKLGVSNRVELVFHILNRPTYPNLRSDSVQKGMEVIETWGTSDLAAGFDSQLPNAAANKHTAMSQTESPGRTGRSGKAVG